MNHSSVRLSHWSVKLRDVSDSEFDKSRKALEASEQLEHEGFKEEATLLKSIAEADHKHARWLAEMSSELGRRATRKEQSEFIRERRIHPGRLRGG